MAHEPKKYRSAAILLWVLSAIWTVIATGLGQAQSLLPIKTIALSDKAINANQPEEIFGTTLVPAINNDGEVLFQSIVTTTNNPTVGSQAIFLSSDGDFVEITRTGESASDLSPDATIASVFDVQFSDSGRIGFLASLQGQTVSPLNDRALFTSNKQTTQLVLKQGDPTHQQETMDTYVSILGYEMNSKGKLLINAGVTDSTGNEAPREVLISDRSGVLEEVYNDDLAREITGLDRSFIRIGGFADNGDFRALLTVSAPSEPTQLARAGVVEDNGQAEIVYQTGVGEIEGFDDEAEIDYFGGSFNNTQAVTVGVGIFDSITGDFIASGLAVVDSNQRRLVSIAGDPISNRPTLLMDSLNDRNSSNRHGDYASTSVVVDLANDSQRLLSVLRYFDDQLTSVLTVGDAAPCQSGSWTTTRLGDPLINDLGQVLFKATISDESGSEDSRQVLYATNLQGDVVPIISSGEQVNVGQPGLDPDMRYVSIIHITSTTFNTNVGRSDGFNDKGQISFSLTFSDGTSGVFTSNRVAIPEPASTFVLLGVAALSLLQRRALKPIAG
ncbi:MAG: choice-of-anchor tandem repeat NxxGxxAF-containing protein [Planctomycetota bacterium]